MCKFTELQKYLITLFIIAILAGLVYEPNYNRLRGDEDNLKRKLELLNQEKTKAISIQKQLQETIKSQQDLDWIEMVLMAKLGVVPEGQTKVYFQEGS